MSSLIVSDIKWIPSAWTMWHFLAILGTDYIHEIPRCISVLRFIQTLQLWSEAICIRDLPPFSFAFPIYNISLAHAQVKSRQFTTYQTYHAILQSELSFTALVSYEIHVSFNACIRHPLLPKLPRSLQPAHGLPFKLAFTLSFSIIVCYLNICSHHPRL